MIGIPTTSSRLSSMLASVCPISTVSLSVVVVVSVYSFAFTSTLFSMDHPCVRSPVAYSKAWPSSISQFVPDGGFIKLNVIEYCEFLRACMAEGSSLCPERPLRTASRFSIGFCLSREVIRNNDSAPFISSQSIRIYLTLNKIGSADVLVFIGIAPDNIIGHSIGEFGCAYNANGYSTAEQILLAAYPHGLELVSTGVDPQSMAVVDSAAVTNDYPCKTN